MRRFLFDGEGCGREGPESQATPSHRISNILADRRRWKVIDKTSRMKMSTKPNILVKITLTQTLSTSLVDIFIILLHLADKFDEKCRNTYSHFQTTPKQAISRRRVKGDGRLHILDMRTLLPAV